MVEFGAVMRFGKNVGCLLLVLASTFVYPQTGGSKNSLEPVSGETAAQQPTAKVEAPPPDSTQLESITIRKPTYPVEAIDRGIQGQVWVKVYVSEIGDVAKVEVVRGDPVLAKAAVNAVMKWKFKPFIHNGKPVKVFAELPVDFAFADKVSEVKLPPEPKKTQYPNAIPVSSAVQTGLLLHKVAPVYPLEARRHHLEGRVILSAVIGKDGRIHELVALGGPQELADAAIAAVQQWRYRPYLLKNEQVEVRTQIIVNFSLR